MVAALHVLRYLKDSDDIEIFLNNSLDLSLTGYHNSDWAAYPKSC